MLASDGDGNNVVHISYSTESTSAVVTSLDPGTSGYLVKCQNPRIVGIQFP